MRQRVLGRGRPRAAGPWRRLITRTTAGRPRASAPGGDDAPASSAVLAVLPFVVMALVAVLDFSAGPGVGLLPMVSLGPAFASLTGGWRRTAVIGLLALALCMGLGVYNGLFEERRGFTAMASVAGVTVAGLAAAVIRQRREAELASVRSIAEVAQRVLLRPVPRFAGHLRAAVSYTSAVAEARIGGDLYEVVAAAGVVRVIIGDVQGKGLEAVETAAVVLGAFREAAHDGTGLLGVGARVERAANRSLRGEKFVTAIIAEISPDGTAVFLNYGHPPPLLLRADGTAEFPEPARYSLPLGLGLHRGESPEPFREDFGPGDQLLFHTDGVTEARDPAGAFYPLEQRAGLLSTPDLDAALDGLRADLMDHVRGPLHDDAAMLLLRYRADEPTGIRLSGPGRKP